mmetsp:Transcript_9810/g.32527  ORF Transcript_9810/g.32527 Transcript_9810/m.32527 type:complete len:235 (-) Transcript_9810:928-1632(-)|eukprot:scaffold33523_cov112-Isochrysis_galbana.AAC.13
MQGQPPGLAPPGAGGIHRPKLLLPPRNRCAKTAINRPLGGDRRGRDVPFQNSPEMEAGMGMPGSGLTPSRAVKVATKFGDGQAYCLPVWRSAPVSPQKVRTESASESWLAAMTKPPLPANWKCRGVAPPVFVTTAVRSRGGHARPPSRSMAKQAIESSPRLETRTKRPLGATAIRPHVLRTGCGMLGSRVDTTCTSWSTSDGLPRPRPAPWISAPAEAWQNLKTETVEESSLTT